MSATSSLDPYYFGTTSRENSPALANAYTSKESTTPETRHLNEPTTPARDPAGIDRKGLIGVGELATPRWGRPSQQDLEDEEREELEDANGLEAADDEIDGPDSPWTIEAVNSESDKEKEPTEVRLITRTIWARPSITEESGGKEILYPWKMSRDLSKQPLPSEPLRLHDESPHAHSSKPPPIDFYCANFTSECLCPPSQS